MALDYGLDLIQQSNGEYICVCPFHADVNPSMRIYPNSNSFHCFGCQAGASIFEFVMRMENIEFKEALYRLAERAGYNSTFVLRDIEIHEMNENFNSQRDQIEKILYISAKRIYTTILNSGIVSKKVLFERFEKLWCWYDRQQYIFDKKRFIGQDSNQLVVILYRFHEVFLQKLQELEKELLQGVNNVE